MLFVHGRPGVGKSSLAQELAHRLKTKYPHGQLYVNMGVAGGRRSERDILRVFLKELGWPEEELRDADAAHLGKVFRAATARRRLLVLLDAARDADQIEATLPGSDRCAVTVTSRANLGGTEHRARHLDTPSPSDAARIMRAYLTSDIELPGDVKVPSDELIAEAAELCGRQPIAMRAICDKARHTRGGLAQAVNELRGSEDWLSALTYGGRDVSARFATEYARVGRRAQEALQVLSLVKASSFVPWVLQPLLDIHLPEAANLMAALSEVGLLDDLESDPAGFPRYGFSPLIRLFAERELQKNLASDDAQAAPRREAGHRFRLATVKLAALIMAVTERDAALGNQPDVPERWVPAIHDWERRVARNASFWVAI